MSLPATGTITSSDLNADFHFYSGNWRIRLK